MAAVIPPIPEPTMITAFYAYAISLGKNFVIVLTGCFYNYL